MDHDLLSWVGFGALVLALFYLDLGILHKKNKIVTSKESIIMYLFYMAIGLLFGVWVWYDRGAVSAAEYVTGYLVEMSLSLDNIFIISIIFKFLSIPEKYQHRVLFWGIIGVIVMRAIVIGLGAILVTKAEWVLYIFALFLVFTGVKMLFMKDHNVDLKDNIVLKYIRGHFPITEKLYDDDFYVYEKGKIFFTPLFVALIMIETIDLVFALDSIPAIFSITTDTYVVYTSNIFAIMGLRSLYFALAEILKTFKYLKYSLALILIFIGSKIYIKYLLDIEKFPASVSLSITIGLLAAGVIASMVKKRA
jgi:tellurite resistance protein TerC